MNRRMLYFGVALISLLLAVSFGLAVEKGEMADLSKKIILAPDKLHWKEGPAVLPGTRMSVLEGDPEKKGFFVMRLKLPAGTKIPAHVHRGRERVTVISGKFHLAEGERPDNPVVLPAGSYFSLPSGSIHNAWVEEETVVQISTTGPWTFLKVGK